MAGDPDDGFAIRLADACQSACDMRLLSSCCATGFNVDAWRARTRVITRPVAVFFLLMILVAGVVTGREIDIGRAFLTKARLRFFRFTCDNRGKHTSLFSQQKLKPTVRYAGALPIANGLGRYGLAESCNLVRSVERFNDPASNFCPARTTLIEGLPLGCLICL